MEKHSCFNTKLKACSSFRIHVPLARRCSMGCIYCNFRLDANVISLGNRPGTAFKTVSTYDEIHQYLQNALKLFPHTKIIGVSGPGDPLENEKELKNLIQVLNDFYLDKILCICTTGRHLKTYLNCFSHKSPLKYITLTINTLNPITALKIYNGIHNLQEAVELINNQLTLIKLAKDRRIKVKVNTVFMEQLNASEIYEMYFALLSLNIDCFNLLKQVVSGNPKQLIDINKSSYDMCREKLMENHFPITQHCKRCRSDFCGC